MFEILPELKSIDILTKRGVRLDASAFQPITDVLRRGIGLQNLERVHLACEMDHLTFRDFLNALESSSCAKRIVELLFYCDVNVEGTRALAHVISRGAFPALEDLNPCIGSRFAPPTSSKNT